MGCSGWPGRRYSFRNYLREYPDLRHHHIRQLKTHHQPLVCSVSSVLMAIKGLSLLLCKPEYPIHSPAKTSSEIPSPSVSAKTGVCYLTR